MDHRVLSILQYLITKVILETVATSLVWSATAASLDDVPIPAKYDLPTFSVMPDMEFWLRLKKWTFIVVSIITALPGAGYLLWPLISAYVKAVLAVASLLMGTVMLIHATIGLGLIRMLVLMLLQLPMPVVPSIQFPSTGSIVMDAFVVIGVIYTLRTSITAITTIIKGMPALPHRLFLTKVLHLLSRVRASGFPDL